MAALVIAGRYAIHAPLASGGMAHLHLGVTRGAVGFTRVVAIKRLLGHLASDTDFVAMFVDEARLASRIRHPNVIPTLDVVVEHNELFVVMEYVHGEALSKLIPAAIQAGVDIPTEIALEVGIGMLEGLHAAHEAKSERGEPLNIVHRDVSPQNVLVGVDGVTRVFDFGIAQAETRVYTSNHGSLKGKLAYMAPEQVRGDAVDRRADVWAASVVLWELLARRRLFVAHDAAGYVQAILESEVRSPSAHSSCPAAIDAIVMKGLQRDPEARWQSARDMAAALQESGRRAHATEVGAWVEERAAETLKERRALIEQIETDPVGGPSLRRQIAALAEANVSSDVTELLPELPKGRTPAPHLPPPTPMDTLGVSSITVVMSDARPASLALSALAPAKPVRPRAKGRALGTAIVIGIVGTAIAVVVAKPYRLLRRPTSSTGSPAAVTSSIAPAATPLDDAAGAAPPETTSVTPAERPAPSDEPPKASPPPRPRPPRVPKTRGDPLEFDRRK